MVCFTLLTYLEDMRKGTMKEQNDYEMPNKTETLGTPPGEPNANTYRGKFLFSLEVDPNLLEVNNR